MGLILGLGFLTTYISQHQKTFPAFICQIPWRESDRPKSKNPANHSLTNLNTKPHSNTTPHPLSPSLSQKKS
jgi:hypothetical protein